MWWQQVVNFLCAVLYYFFLGNCSTWVICSVLFCCICRCSSTACTVSTLCCHRLVWKYLKAPTIWTLINMKPVVFKVKFLLALHETCLHWAIYDLVFNHCLALLYSVHIHLHCQTCNKSELWRDSKLLILFSLLPIHLICYYYHMPSNKKTVLAVQMVFVWCWLWLFLC